MTHSAWSVLVFAVYLGVLGLTLLVTPNLLLGLFGIPGTDEVWIRVVGMLVLLIGYYYQFAAIQRLTVFFRATVWARGSVILFFTGFVALGLAPPVLVLFGAIDLAGAVWTALSLRAEAAAGRAT